MRKKYRNEIFNCLSSLGYNQDDFELIEESSQNMPSSELVYKNTPLKFIIRNSNYSFDEFDYQYVRFGPSYILSNFFPEMGFTDFENVLTSIKHWLNTEIQGFIEEESIPDLWFEFKKGNKTLNINDIDFDNKNSFSNDERQQIKIAINELKYLIQKNLQTNDEEQELVINRLNYLVDASNRLNKFDWKSTAISTLISITISLSLDTSKGQILFNLFKRVFSVIPMLADKSMH